MLFGAPPPLSPPMKQMFHKRPPLYISILMSRSIIWTFFSSNHFTSGSQTIFRVADSILYIYYTHTYIHTNNPHWNCIFLHVAFTTRGDSPTFSCFGLKIPWSVNSYSTHTHLTSNKSSFASPADSPARPPSLPPPPNFTQSFVVLPEASSSFSKISMGL